MESLLLFDIFVENKKYANICIKSLYGSTSDIFIPKNNREKQVIRDIIKRIDNKKEIYPFVLKNIKKYQKLENDILILVITLLSDE